MTVFAYLLTTSLAKQPLRWMPLKHLGTVEEPKTRVWSTFTDLRYGPITIQSEVLNAVFSESDHQVLVY